MTRTRVLGVFALGLVVGLFISHFMPPVVSRVRLSRYVRQLDDELQKNPSDANLWSLRGNVGNNLGDRDYAVRCYRRALELNPSDLLVYMTLADVLAAGGLRDQATNLLQTGIAIGKTTDVQMVSLLEWNLRAFASGVNQAQ